MAQYLLIKYPEVLIAIITISEWHKGFKRNLDDITEAVVHHTEGEGNCPDCREELRVLDSY